jgi:hypothetical protein
MKEDQFKHRPSCWQIRGYVTTMEPMMHHGL